MSYQPHFIASFDADSGLNTSLEPFLIPEKAFPVLEDAYCWRGRVKLREGNKLLGRLRRKLAAKAAGNFSAAGAGTVVVNLLTAIGVVALEEPDAMIEPGSAADPLVITIAAPIAQVLTDATGTGVFTIAPAGLITSATINYNTGALTLVYSGAAAASAATVTGGYFPSLPVMGLRTRELIAKNNELMVAFDQKYAYLFNQTTNKFEEAPSATPTVWHGSNSNFFWSTNWGSKASLDLFWVTNCSMTSAPQDPMYYYDGLDFTPFAPLITAAETLYNAECIIPYKSRLLMFNTWEGTTAGTIIAATNFPRRLRYSWVGDPTTPTAFRSDTIGTGGWIDAPTNEIIVSVGFIKDTLLVKCEKSSWKLVYTGNDITPFVFQKINTELGSESKFSLVPFDRGVFSVADVGITTDDSVNVERIDLQIPSTIFNFRNSDNGVERVHGIRDFSNEMVYWNYPESQTETTYPNKVLAYNYRNNTYAKFNDSFTCFGTFQKGQDETWAQLTYKTWADWDKAWNSGTAQALFPDVVAGNQHGFVVKVQEQTSNDETLFIKAINFVTGIFTVPNHNLRSGDIITLYYIAGSGALPPTVLNGRVFRVNLVNANEVTLDIFDPTIVPPTSKFTPLIGTTLVDATTVYQGGGVIEMNQNFNIQTKVFCPFYEQGAQCRLGYVDFLLDRTPTGELTSDVYIDENEYYSMTDTGVNTALQGTNTVLTRAENTALFPFQANQNKIWHRQFIQSVAQNFQVVLSLTQEQNATAGINDEPVVLHAMAFYLSPNARLTP